MKASVDEETCSGCELCAQTCPEVFKMEEGKAVPCANPVPKEVEQTCREAADQCPVASITIQD